MSDAFIEREGPELSPEALQPNSRRQKEVVERIEGVLRLYVVKGTREELHRLALKIWRVTRL